MRKSALWIALVALLGGTAQARLWTSSDGAKTFEGELKTYDADSGMVTVLVNGRPLVFPQDKLSAADITFLKEVSVAPASTAASVMGEKFAKVKLHLLDGKRYKSADMVKTPDYYVLYYSASW